MTFFKKVVMSVKDFEKYPELATQSVVNTIKYFMLLIAILTIVISAIFVGQMYNFLQYIRNDLPDFKFEDNILQMEQEEPINIKNSNLFFKTFIVDTNEIEDEQFKLYKNQIANSTTGIAFLKDKLQISIDSEMEPIEYSYSALCENVQPKNISKEEIVGLFNNNEVFYMFTILFITLFAYGFMYYLIETLMLVVVIMLLGYITSMIVKIRLKPYAIFNMALYAFTLPIILLLIYSIIHMVFGFEIIYFNIMYFGIACIYMITAILIIKSDLIKRQQELAKIIEEQARIAEWQKTNKEDEENKKQEEKQNKEDKEKEQDEGKDNNENNNNENGKQNEDGNKDEKDKPKEKNGKNEESNQGKNTKRKKKDDEGLDKGLEPQGNMFENKKGIQER